MNPIVTPTIHAPTEALQKYAEIADRDNWSFIIIGDLKTPHKEMTRFANKYHNTLYVSPMAQKLVFPEELSEAIGWNCIQRRNLGFITAYNDGADLIASVDDDNIPLHNW